MDSWSTGTFADGKAWQSTDQVPWSSPQLSWSSPTHVGWTVSAVSTAMSGAPGAGYWTANNSGGNPKKSWMVRGAAMAVRAVNRSNQWAETTSTARGFVAGW